ncbi:DUF952 domain-containing protein [Cellulomonas sp. P5_E12]
MEILHLTERAHWDDAVRTGSYRWSTRGRTLEQVGFVHASTREQLPGVAAFLYTGATEQLCVLVMETDTIAAAGTRVAFEDGGKGELYPHIYGPIDPAWVSDVRPARMAGADLSW